MSMKNKNVFKDITWSGRIEIWTRAYGELVTFASNEAALQAHFSTLPKRTELESDGPVSDDPYYIEPEAIDEAIKAQTKEFVEHALYIYKEQMVVVAVTLIEVMLKDYTISLFENYPERMTPFLNEFSESRMQGYIRFQKILDSPSKSLLIRDLASTASQNLLKGTFPKQLDRLSKTQGIHLPESLKDNLIKINAMRNKIVHEGDSSAIKSKDVFETCEQLHAYLTECCSQLNIPTEMKLLVEKYEGK